MGVELKLSSNPTGSSRIWEDLHETVFSELFGEKGQILSSDTIISLEREADSVAQVSWSLTTSQVNKASRLSISKS